MAYTIRVYDSACEDCALMVADAIRERVSESRFTATLSSPVYEPKTRKRSDAWLKPSDAWLITVRPVRLREAKPYCGQHPGECLVSPFGERKKLNGRWLEWDDWVEFHSLVNDVLDACKGLRGDPVRADVWSNPAEQLDTGKKMWVRRDNKRRVHFDYDEKWRPGRMVPDRIWNAGSPDQFQKGG